MIILICSGFPFALVTYQHRLGALLTLLGQLFAVLELKNNDELQRNLSSLGDAMMDSFNAEPLKLS